MLFSDIDRAKVSEAIADAESRTAGEIVVILSGETHRYPETCLSVAALLALAVPMIALVAGWSFGALFGAMFGDWSDGAIVETRSLEALMIVQALVFGTVLAALWFSGFGRRLTPPSLRRNRVHRAALTQFKARGLEATTGRTGVLIYIDEPEHIAEIVADTGIYTKVAPDHWGTTISALIDGIKAGNPAAGVVKAVALAGDVLAVHFPPLPGDVNELPDGLIEI
jgi:putative membrane protein